MSEQAAEGQAPAAEEAVELPPMGDAAFGALMDILVSEEDQAPAGEGGAPAGAPAAGAGQAAPAAEGAGAAGAPAAPAQPGAPGEPGVPGAGLPIAGVDTAVDKPDAGAAAAGAAAGTADGDTGGRSAGDLPDTWTAEPADLIPKLGELSTKFEEKVAEAYQATALEEVRKEHGAYFDAIEKHPRLLVGQQVPAIGREGNETIRDTEDAKEWQDAVKHVLAQEIRDRAGREMEENGDFLNTVHASIELFQNNTDLIPGTKGFDVDLANRFAELAKPYELRVEGKLQGYTIPVQPIINQLRSQVTAERAAKTAAPPAPSAAAATGAGAPANPPPAPAANQAQTDEQPQGGIQSKAGQSDSAEDFSTLFGTIGLPNLKI